MTTITNPWEARIQAVFLKGHLKLVAAGMTPPRGVRKGDLLKKAGAITGRKYARGHYQEAADDLQRFIKENS